MKLSVITINLNNDQGLQRTIKSVLNQTYKDFEFIIIDGASTDNSICVIKNLIAKSDKENKWISEPDSGIYEAMNKGIKIANGEYLLFLNSGDYLINNHVLELVFSNLHTCDFLIGCSQISKNSGIVYQTNTPEKLTFKYIYYHGIPHQSTFIRREMFFKYGMYREDFKYNSDIEFWYRTIVLNGCTTESLPIIISDYNLDGISSKENYSEAYRKELDEIFAHPVLRLLGPDYEEWKREREEMKIMYWAKSKPALNFLIKGLFYIASGLKEIRK